MASFNMWAAPLRDLWASAVGYAPQLAAALLILAAGLILAWLARSLVGLLFRWLRLEEKFSGLWLFRLWHGNLQDHRPLQSVANFFFYAILFLAILFALRVLSAGFGTAILDALLGLLPRVLSFTLILFLGALMAMAFSVVAQWILAGSGVRHPSFWGKVTAWGTLGVAFMFSLEQLGAAGRFLTILALIALGAAGLALALAFGLGCKDIAREFVIEMIKKNNR